MSNNVNPSLMSPEQIMAQLMSRGGAVPPSSDSMPIPNSSIGAFDNQ